MAMVQRKPSPTVEGTVSDAMPEITRALSVLQHPQQLSSVGGNISTGDERVEVLAQPPQSPKGLGVGEVQTAIDHVSVAKTENHPRHMSRLRAAKLCAKGFSGSL